MTAPDMLSIVQLHNLPVSDQLGLIRPVDRGQVRLEVLLVLGSHRSIPMLPVPVL